MRRRRGCFAVCLPDNALLERASPAPATSLTADPEYRRRPKSARGSWTVFIFSSSLLPLRPILFSTDVFDAESGELADTCRHLLVIARGVDGDVFSPDHRTRAHGGPVRALYAGSMADEEELSTLVRVVHDREDIDLVMVGDGPLRPTLERVLPRAFVGTPQGIELSRTFADGDIFLFPSRSDMFDHALLQAFSSGVPVVAFSGLGRGEIIQDGVSGIIVHDDAEFAAAISFLVADENARLEMGLEARRQATRFRWSTVGNRLLALYAELISERSPLGV